MEKRKKSNADAPPIGERLLTLREAADVLRLSTIGQSWLRRQSWIVLECH